MRYKIFLQCCLLLLFFAAGVQGQNDKALLRELAEENKKSVEALALYPPETRLAILEAATYPEILIKMDNTRQKTAAAFRHLIEDFPQSTQLVFYEIARYPGLLQQLVEQQESLAARQDALRQLPEEQREDAYEVVENQMRTLLKINELDQTARSTFEDMIRDYPAPARTAFRQLLELPEVLAILNEDLRFTVLVGDVYRADPAWVIRKTDSLNLVVAREHAEEKEEWKRQIENDPEAQQELQAASLEYAAEYGYRWEDTDDPYVPAPQYAPVVVVHHYPWWFGYPWWYPNPCWEPYPWWYNWGFYHYQYRFVVVYMPSGHFMDWYFHHPRHHHHYSHLSSHFVRHYYGHRRSGTSISVGVGNWHDRNRAVISDDWMKDQGRLPKRMAEYGRFEESRQAYNARNPKNPVDQETYLDKNRRKYPEMEQSKTQAQNEIKRERETAQNRPSDWAPPKDPAPAVIKPRPARDTEIKPVPEKPDKPAPRQQDKPRTDPPKTRPSEKAEEYHRGKWEDTKRQETRREPTPAPRPQQQKAVTPTTQPQKNTATPPRNTNKTPKTEGRKN